jgi:hypothetical protein
MHVEARVKLGLDPQTLVHLFFFFFFFNLFLRSHHGALAFLELIM